MFHLVDQDPDGFDDSDLSFVLNQERLMLADLRSGPTEDAQERTAPYINMLPDESETEEGSPLDFKVNRRNMTYMMIDDQIRQAYAMDLSGKDATNKHARLIFGPPFGGPSR